MKFQDEYMAIYEDFKANSKFFQAIGNETRQGILLFLIQSGEKGARVNEITENAHLSRPAVSHHLNVLKDAGIIHCRPEGTSHYYFIDIRKHLPLLGKLNKDVGVFLREYYKADSEELKVLEKMGVPMD
ncbi:MAG: winged helix-turn-helix transcriptional regulator [Clostridia bacterium]|nr:winged helix-turn-helix transcriptional regulator [Clostridia bacterium]